MSYQSPIEINIVEPFIESIRTKTDEYVYRSILDVGVNVDKDELVKALAYDRDQYEKGYADGKLDAVPVEHAEWIENDNGTWSCGRCHSWIPNEQHYYARFCLYCGAKMDGGEKDATVD